MTTLKIGKEETDFLARVAKGKYVDETLAEKKRRQRRARLKKGLAGVRIPDKKAKKKGHHERRMASVRKQLETGVYDKPEFSTSMPDESTTVASIVSGGRGFGLQSPAPSPPGTPVRRATEAPMAPPTPLALPMNPERGSGEAKLKRRRRRKKSIEQLEGTTESDSDEKEDSEAQRERRLEQALRLVAERRRKQEEKYEERRRKQARKIALRTRPKGVARRRGDVNVPRFKLTREMAKKERQAFKSARLNKRQKITSHHPMVPKLQIRQSGPGQFSVRSTGVTPQIEKHVKSLLSRLTGKLFVKERRLRAFIKVKFYKGNRAQNGVSFVRAE